jgi:hypothetical protein
LRAGRTFANPQIANILERLMKLGLIGMVNEQYLVLDNLLGEAAKRLGR